MKKLILAAMSIALFITPLWAEEELTKRQEDVQLCTRVAELAGNMMTIRQGNRLSYVEVLKVTDGNPLAEILLNEVWNVPVYFGLEAKQQAIATYKDQTFVQCFQAKTR